MKIKEKKYGDVTVLTLSAVTINDALGLTLHPQVKELLGKGVKKIIIDLGKVKWFGSTSLGALLASFTSVKEAGGDLRVARPTRKIHSVFVYTQIIRVLKHYDSIEEAVSSFSKEEE